MVRGSAVQSVQLAPSFHCHLLAALGDPHTLKMPLPAAISDFFSGGIEYHVFLCGLLGAGKSSLLNGWHWHDGLEVCKYAELAGWELLSTYGGPLGHKFSKPRFC